MIHPRLPRHSLHPGLCTFLALLLAACGPTIADTPTSRPTSTPISTPTPVAILSTFTPRPTETPIPTEKAAQATHQAAIQLTPTGQGCEWLTLGSSPDRQWEIRECEPMMGSYADFTLIVNLSDYRQWQILLNPGKSGYGYLGWHYHWSRDGVFFYFSQRYGTVGLMAQYQDASMLSRLNLNTGELNEILPEDFYAFAFSEDDQLAYIKQSYQPPQFMDILDLDTGEAQHYSLGSTYCALGHMMWSPEEDRIVLTAVTCAEYPYIASLFTYIIMDTHNGDYHAFYSSSKPLPRPYKWEHDYPLFHLMFNYDPASTDNICWVLNLDVGGLLPAPCQYPFAPSDGQP